MKLLKHLKQTIIENNQIFNVIQNCKIVDKDGNESDFRHLNNAEKNLFLTHEDKDMNLVNRIHQNSFYASLYNNTAAISYFKKLNYEERLAKIHERITQSNYYLSSFYFFIKEGQKVISLEKSTILEQFSNTKIDNINFQDIKFFLDFFYISIEKTINNIYVDGIFVENQKDSLELNVLYLKKIDAVSINATIETLQCIIKKEGSVESSLNDTIKDILELNVIFAQSNPNYNIDLEKENNNDKAIIEFAFKICINTILFFNQVRDNSNSNYEISVVDGTLNQNKIKNNKDYPKYISNTNYNYYLKNNSKQNKDMSLNGNSRKITQQFIVSGHYRKQPYGTKAEEQKYRIIWIEPYLKGIEYESANTIKNTIL